MKSRVTGTNRSGSGEAVKEASRTVRLHANTFSEHMLLETRIGDYARIEVPLVALNPWSKDHCLRKRSP
jgi:hypothetical protein